MSTEYLLQECILGCLTTSGEADQTQYKTWLGKRSLYDYTRREFPGMSPHLISYQENYLLQHTENTKDPLPSTKWRLGQCSMHCNNGKSRRHGISMYLHRSIVALFGGLSPTLVIAWTTYRPELIWVGLGIHRSAVNVQEPMRVLLQLNREGGGALSKHWSLPNVHLVIDQNNSGFPWKVMVSCSTLGNVGSAKTVTLWCWSGSGSLVTSHW